MGDGPALLLVVPSGSLSVVRRGARIHTRVQVKPRTGSALDLADGDRWGVAARLLRRHGQVRQRGVSDAVGVEVERRGIVGVKALNKSL